MSGPLRRFLRWLLVVAFVAAGANHFLKPAPYLAMMPPWLPWPDLMNRIAGAAEMLGGLGVIFPVSRRWAGWGLIALLVAVFPANLQVAIHGWPGYPIAPWILWARLPFQLLFIAWVRVAAFPPQAPCFHSKDET